MSDPVSDAADKFERKHGHIVGQFLRFAVVGVINTATDWLILLLLSKITGITSGNGIIPLNMISFGTAVTSSYFLHMHWSFADSEGHEQGKKFSRFLGVNLIALLINTLVVRIVSTNISPMFGLAPGTWLFVAKAVATGVSMIWNFIGFKLFVFKSSR